jgi:hypothetical protein
MKFKQNMTKKKQTKSHVKQSSFRNFDDKTYEDALRILTTGNRKVKQLQDTSKRFGFMQVPARPPTCLKTLSNLNEPKKSNQKLINKNQLTKHSTISIRNKRLQKSMKNDQKIYQNNNKELNGKQSVSHFAIIDQMIAKDYDQRINGGGVTPPPPPPPPPPPSLSYEQVDLKKQKKELTSILVGKKMSKRVALLITKRGLLKKLKFKRSKVMLSTINKSSNNVLSLNILQLENEIDQLMRLSDDSTINNHISQVKEDYTEFIMSPLKKMKHIQPNRHMAVSLPPPSPPPIQDDDGDDLTLFKFARTGDWQKKLEKNKKEHSSSTMKMDHWFDASKSKNEIIRMPTKEDTRKKGRIEKLHHFLPPPNQLSSPTMRHTPGTPKIDPNILSILRSAGTSESSRRVSWSPDVCATKVAKKRGSGLTSVSSLSPKKLRPLESTYVDGLDPGPHAQKDRSSAAVVVAANRIKPLSIVTDMDKIPSTAELNRRLMSRRSEFRQIMGRKTGAEIAARKRKRRLSALQATTRALGRLKLMNKRKKEKEEKASKRRNSVLGQFITSNL